VEVDVPTADGRVRRAFRVQYTRTGQLFDDLTTAFNTAADDGLVAFTRLSKQPDNMIGRRLPFGPLMADMQAINQYLKSAKLTPGSKEARALRGLGLGFLLDNLKTETHKRSVRVLNPLEIHVSNVKYDEFNSTLDEALIPFREGKTAEGKLLANIVAGDGGFIAHEYYLPGMDLKLHQEQILLLRSLIERPVVDPRTAVKTLGKGVDQKGIESQIMKLEKRSKGTYSPRQVSISGNEGLGKFVGVKNFNMDKDWAKHLLILDSRQELLLAGIHEGTTDVTLQKALKSAYNSLDYNYYGDFQNASIQAKNFFGYAFEGYELKEDDYKKLGTLLMKAYNDKSDKSTTDVFLDLVEKSKFSNKIKSRVKSITEKMEVSVDGAFRGNAKYFQNYIDTLSESIKNYDAMIEAGTATPFQINMKKDLETTRRGIASENRKAGKWLLDQNKIYGLTGRINFRDSQGFTPQIKGRFGFVSDIVDKKGRSYAFVTPDVNVKREAGLTPAVNLDVLGREKGIRAIAPDIQSIAQYGGAFIEDAGDGTGVIPKMTRAYVQQQLAEMKTIMETGVIPRHVIDSVMEARVETEDVKFARMYQNQSYKMGTKKLHVLTTNELRNKMLTGDVFDPEVFNAIYDYYYSGTIQDKRAGGKRFIVARTPELMRFDIEAESASLLGQDNVGRLLAKEGADYYNAGMEVTNTQGAVRNENIKLPVVRFKDHRMIYSDMNSVIYQAAHGGFDFDDKGMPLLRSFVDTNSGQRRLALFTFRQPPSLREFVVNSFSKDQESLNTLFGHNRKFMEALEQMSATDQEAADILRYMRMVPDKNNGAEFMVLHSKYAGVLGTNENLRQGFYYGTSKSTVTTINDVTKRTGQPTAGAKRMQATQANVDRVILEAYEMAYGEGIPELNSRIIRQLAITKTGSALALDEKTFRALSDADQLEAGPMFARLQAYKYTVETGITPFNEEEKMKFAEIARKYKLGPLDPSDTESAFRKALSEVFRGTTSGTKGGRRNQEALASLTATMDLYKFRITTADPSGIIGSYINSLTAFGSIGDQYQDIMETLTAAQARPTSKSCGKKTSKRTERILHSSRQCN